MEKIAVERQIWIASTPDRVWEALTDDKLLGKWWTPDEWQIPTRAVGGRVQFGADATDAAYATITVFDPPHELTLNWDANEKFPTMNMVTTFRLVAEKGGTRVNVTEAGFEGLPPEIRQERADQTSEGYVLVLNDLKLLLER